MDSNGDPDWELVSSSSEEGEGGTELQQEAEALANSFRLGEPSPPHSGPSSSAPGSPTSAELGPLRGAAGEPAPGSPQRPQRLQLLAAPLPAPDWPCPPPTSSGSTASAGPPGAGSAESAAGRGSPRRFATLGGSPTAQEAVASSSSAEDVCLRVVRSDDLQALEGAVAALEKRAAHREQELTLAQLRLSGTQAALAAESREAFRLRRLALMAGSVCAFLGLKALLGWPQPRVRCCGASAAVEGTAATLRCTAAAGSAGQGLLCDAELDRLVAVKVEPLK